MYVKPMADGKLWGIFVKYFKKDEINILDVQRALLNKSMRKW